MDAARPGCKQVVFTIDFHPVTAAIARSFGNGPDSPTGDAAVICDVENAYMSPIGIVDVELLFVKCEREAVWLQEIRSEETQFT